MCGSPIRESESAERLDNIVAIMVSGLQSRSQELVTSFDHDIIHARKFMIAREIHSMIIREKRDRARFNISTE